MTEDIEDFVGRVRAFLDEHASRRETDAVGVWGQGKDHTGYFTDDPSDVEKAKVDAARAWQRTRYENGFGWITGPAEFGGNGLTTTHDLMYDLIESEYDVPDTGVLSLIGLGMIGPTILAHAREDIKQRYLPAMYSGEVIACQLFSEPAAGSDLAGVQTKAVRDGDIWRVNGQKVWTSVAQHSQIGMALCRTDPDQPKHKGITAFLVDMSAPGVDVRPLRQMSGGAEFNEVFLTDVEVPDDHRLGEVDGGWAVGMTTLMNERASVSGESDGPVTRAQKPEFLGGLLRATGHQSDAAARAKLGALVADLTAAKYMGTQSLRRMKAGSQPGPEASVGKLRWAQNLTRIAHLATDLVGPKAIADTGEWGTYSWNELLLSSPAFRILGGTEEIMKNILGERVLGLPKEPSSDSRTPFNELRRSGNPS